MTDDLRRIHCVSCGVTVGWTKAVKLNGSLLCSEACNGQPSITSNEERDDVIVALYRSGKVDVLALAMDYDLTRQRVHQILNTRGVSYDAKLDVYLSSLEDEEVDEA